MTPELLQRQEACEKRWERYLRELREHAALPQPLACTGTLVRVAGLVLEAAGVRTAVGSVCEVTSPGQPTVHAEVVGFNGNRAYLMPTGEMHGLSSGARVSPHMPPLMPPRFGAQGHVVQLVNHPSVTDSLPWATNQNLRTSLDALSKQMDTEHDVLVLYLSSHGGADFKLATRHWPLDVPVLTPQILRSMLDEVRIRNRVIAVSACYAGGWIAPLLSDNTLVAIALIAARLL